MHPLLSSLLFRLSILLALALSTRAASDPGWILPEDGTSFGRSVPIIVEVSAAIPAGYYAEIYQGENLKGSLLIESLSGGIRRYSGWINFSADGGYTLTAKVTDGFTVTTVEGPSIHVVTPAPAPTFYPEPASNITAVSMTLHGGFDMHGVDVSNQYRYWEYGTTTAYGNSTRGRIFVIGQTEPVAKVTKQQFGIHGLQPSTTYHYRLVFNGVPGPDQVATTTANHTPEARNDFGVVGPNGTAEIYVLRNDSDEGVMLEQTFTNTVISAVSTPAHGTVEISQSGIPRLRYTAGVSFEESDTFTYTIRDPFGGEATASVLIRSREAYLDSISGRYSTVGLYDAVPIATLSVNAGKGGAYSGVLVYYGARFSFSGRFHQADDAESPSNVSLRLPREGRPPLRLDFGIFTDDYFYPGIPAIMGWVEDEAIGKSADLDIAPILLGAGEAVPEAGQFNVEMRNPSVASAANSQARIAAPTVDISGTPQGHGFSTMKLSKRGALIVRGKTGDHQPFSSGAHMRSDRKIMLNARSGAGRRGSLYGIVGFDALQATSSEGSLHWSGPTRTAGAYQAGFSLTLNAEGKKFDSPAPKADAFSFPANSLRMIKVTIHDHNGGVIAEDTMTLDSHNRLDSGPGKAFRIRIRINRETGTFRGTLVRSESSSIRLSGIIQPGEGRGVGVVGATGFEAPVELTLP